MTFMRTLGVAALLATTAAFAQSPSAPTPPAPAGATVTPLPAAAPAPTVSLTNAHALAKPGDATAGATKAATCGACHRPRRQFERPAISQARRAARALHGAPARAVPDRESAAVAGHDGHGGIAGAAGHARYRRLFCDAEDPARGRRRHRDQVRPEPGQEVLPGGRGDLSWRRQRARDSSMHGVPPRPDVGAGATRARRIRTSAASMLPTFRRA